MDVKASTMYQAAPIQSQPPAVSQPAVAPAAVVQKSTQTRSNAPANEPRKVKFSVGRDYQVMTVIGDGAYGVVVRAIHRASGREVAIKKVSLGWTLASRYGSG